MEWHSADDHRKWWVHDQRRGTGSGSFQADNYYLGGNSNTATVTDSINTSGVSNPAPQAVYQSQRYSNFSYVFPGLQAGASYTVRLHFAETYWSSAGQRVFNVSLNGSQVLSNFDSIAATGAKDKAIIEQFTATSTTLGVVGVTAPTATTITTGSITEVIVGITRPMIM